MRIVGYWHIYTVNHWRRVVQEELAALKESGLMERANSIRVGATGPDLAEVREMLPHRKLEIEEIPEARFEFHSLGMLWRDAIQLPDFRAFYLHTKGVSYPDDKFARWRELMLAEVVGNHPAHLAALDRVDVSGFNYYAEADAPIPFFSGNFWFANSAHIRKLPSPLDLDQENRYLAESWLTSIPHRYHAPPFIEPNP